jgi:hypothetical protein
MDAYSYEYYTFPYAKSLKDWVRINDSNLTFLKKNKVSLAVCIALNKLSTQPLLSSVINDIARREILLHVYITNFIKAFVTNSFEIQTNIISLAISFINKLRGKVPTQSFVNRSTKQSIKLLPAY